MLNRILCEPRSANRGAVSKKITIGNLKINKSTLWYQQKKIKEVKTIKVYNKTKVRIK